MLDKVTLELTPQMLEEAVKATSLEELLTGVHSPGFPDRIGHYTYTHSGRIFFPCDPRSDEVHWQDLAAGGSRIFRFNGQTERGMTINEHQWHASYLAPDPYKLEALLHDAPESYIGDLIRPLKVLPIYGQFYLKIEDGIAQKIAERYGLTYPWPMEVRRVDEMLCHAEIAQNIRSKVDGVHFDKAAYDRAKETPQEMNFQYWSPELARVMWESRFKELALERGVMI